MRPTQSQPAIFEGKNTMPAVLIAAEGMRREAHSELDMGAAQAYPILDRARNHGHGCNGSFPGV